jgi:branched-chain amino acid transport system substrate-binding protein
MTDPLQAEGEMLSLGARLAMQDAQDQIGNPGVEMVILDSPCNAEEAATHARKVAADPTVSGVVGYLCVESVRAVHPIYRQAGLALINSTIPAEYAREQEDPNVFPLQYGDLEQAAFLAAYCKFGLGVTRIAILSDRSAYGQTLKSSFLAEAKQLGLELVAKVDISPKAAEAAKAVQLLKSANPELTFLATYPDTARLFLLERQRRDLGGKILGPDRLADRIFFEMTGRAVEGVLVCQPILLDAHNPEVTGFVRRFEQLHKRRPDWLAAGGYDAMRLALEVLSRSGPDRSSFMEGLRLISGSETAFDGLSGPIFFRKNGTSQRRLYVGVVHQGKLEPANPPTVAYPVNGKR